MIKHPKYINLSTPEQEKTWLDSLTSEDKERYSQQIDRRFSELKKDIERMRNASR